MYLNLSVSASLISFSSLDQSFGFCFLKKLGEPGRREKSFWRMGMNLFDLIF